MAGMALSNIREIYHREGFCFPVDVCSEGQAGEYRSELEMLERCLIDKKMGNKDQLNYPHVVFRFANEIVRSQPVLDAVEQILGPDILIWGGTFFIKEPHTDSYVSWHQDLRYWGLENDEGMVSAWLALSPVTLENGCMRFVPGSHKQPLVEHRDDFDEKNFLTRGQQAAVEINEDETENVELRPGQMSLHHGRLLHASSPNRSSERRIGFVMNFISAENRQVVGQKDFAMLVRGEDRFGHFEHIPSPESDLSAEALAWHNRILQAQNEAIYDGARQA